MTYTFSKNSKEKLATCHPELQILWEEVIKHVDCIIICGHRSKEDQDFAFSKKNSKVQWPNSKHNSIPSKATDVAPYFKGVGIDWEDTIAFSYFAGKVMMIAERLHLVGLMPHKLRWGGDWDGDGKNKDQTFNDLVHFELKEE